jgi:hypothetical protein
MEATTYNLGDRKVRMERERIGGVLVVHEVHERVKGTNSKMVWNGDDVSLVRTTCMKDVWYVDGPELLRVKDTDRSPFRTECKSRAQVEKLVRKMNLLASQRR